MKGELHMKKVYLYGILGADEQYRVARYFCLSEENISVTNIVNSATIMKMKYPTIEHVYAVDNRYNLYADFMEAFKHPSVENNAIFKDICEREGLKII